MLLVWNAFFDTDQQPTEQIFEPFLRRARVFGDKLFTYMYLYWWDTSCGAYVRQLVVWKAGGHCRTLETSMHSHIFGKLKLVFLYCKSLFLFLTDDRLTKVGWIGHKTSERILQHRCSSQGCPSLLLLHGVQGQHEVIWQTIELVEAWYNSKVFSKDGKKSFTWREVPNNKDNETMVIKSRDTIDESMRLLCTQWYIKSPSIKKC